MCWCEKKSKLKEQNAKIEIKIQTPKRISFLSPLGRGQGEGKEGGQN